MALEQKLSLKLAQKLVMTPTLQQAIKLLQLSRLELEQALAQELVVNPVLELSSDATPEEDAGGSEEPVAEEHGGGEEEAPGGPAEVGPSGDVTEAGGGEPEGSPAEAFSEVELDSLFSNYLHDVPTTASSWEEDEDGPMATSAAPMASLYEALCAELRMVELPPGLRPVCEYVIGNLDGDGYLRAPEGEIASRLGVEPELVERALDVVQHLEPAGIAARNLRECFILQLDRMLEQQPDPVVARARAMMVDTFEEFLTQRWERLTARLHLTLDEIRETLPVIHRLNPRPGNVLGPNDNIAVEPDVQVMKVDGEWRVSLVDDGMPRLHLSPRYLQLLQSRALDAQAKSYLRERMRSALWFLRSVDQRQSTIMKVAQAIVRRQAGFLDFGVSSLKPLVLKDIADDIGMHESTVSRVVSNKYMATPRGVVPMKFFFHSAISHAISGDISSVAVRERIKELVSSEEPKRPLSDARIARQLNRTGIRIARRTVAKYREELGIPSSEQRRRTLK
jgi:RNA polymerase sigma-54 factor